MTRDAALAALLLAFVASACSRAAEPPNVLVITIDTLRADRLSAATGAVRVTTPRLDELAREGVLCTHASTPRAKTTPALASLMTGLEPHAHGVRDLMQPLALGHATLAERLRDAGWDTGAIVANYVLQARYSGLERGFAQWTEDLPDAQRVPPEDVPERRAASVTDGALRALGLAQGPAASAGPQERFTRDGKPWFLWLHYMDPHGSYAPPDEHRVFRSDAPELVPPASPRQFVAEYNAPPETRDAQGRIDAAKVKDLYDGEVRYVDAEIGRLLDALRAAGELDRTLLVVTSDHGESFGEHDYWFEHGRDAYEACLRVPLVVRFPANTTARPAGGRCAADIALADLAPTLLDALGLPPLHARRSGDPSRGVSRLPELLGVRPRPRPVLGEKLDRFNSPNTVQHKCVRIGDWKLVQRWALVAEPGGRQPAMHLLAEELYDLAADPREEADLRAAPPGTAPLTELRAVLATSIAADERFASVAGELERLRAELEARDPAAARVLQGLGY